MVAEKPLPFIMGAIQSSLAQSIVLGMGGAMLLGPTYGGGLVCIQHLSLRIVLTQDKKIPWNYARFLNYCADRRLLQRIGGRYRVIHRELLDHFGMKN